MGRWTAHYTIYTTTTHYYTQLPVSAAYTAPGRPRQKRRPRRHIIENLQVLRGLGRQVGKAGRPQQYHGRSSGWRLHDSAMLVAMSRPDASPGIGLCSRPRSQKGDLRP